MNKILVINSCYQCRFNSIVWDHERVCKLLDKQTDPYGMGVLPNCPLKDTEEEVTNV